jgi:hypothetical protein
MIALFGASTVDKKSDPSVPINKIVTRPGNRKWFSLFDDILYRYGLTVIAFYWQAFTHPFGFLYYTFRMQS